MSSTLTSPYSKTSNANPTKRASELLALDDTKQLAIAIAEAAVEEIRTNRVFAERVRTFYQQIATAPVRQKAPKNEKKEVKVVPIKKIEGREINPAAPLDPYFLLEAYGSAQLPVVLDRFSRQKLLEAVDIIAARTPGEKLKNSSKATRENVIQFILDHVK